AIARQRFQPGAIPARFALVQYLRVTSREVFFETEVQARRDDLELDFVVQLRVFLEAVEPGVHQLFTDLLRQIPRNERVEAVTDVDVRMIVYQQHQLGLAGRAIPHHRASLAPDAVGDELAIERRRQRTGRGADDLRRIPVGHHGQD